MEVFVAALDDLLIPKWVDRLDSLGMTCAIHPDFSFSTHSAILAELTGGVLHYPAEDFWYTESDEVEKALKDAEAYEASVRPDQLKLHKFERWA